MKRTWHIRIRILVTLIGLTCLILLMAGAGFSLSLRGYIRSRVSSQLRRTLESALSERSSKGHGKDGKHPQSHRDRLAGSGSALILDQDGTLVTILSGEEEEAEDLAACFKERGLSEEIGNELITAGSGSYAVTLVRDPLADGQYVLSYVDVTSLMSLEREVGWMLMAVMAGAILLSVFLSFRFARSIASPVQTLSEFAADIGNGSLSQRQLNFRDEEFNQLADEMNRMAGQLDAARLNREMFFQNVSHELRTPLTSIRGSAEGIACGLMEPKPAADVILAETDKLTDMVEDILYLSRRRKITEKKPAEPLDLREVLSLCAFELNGEAAKRGVAFHYDFAEEPILYAMHETDAQRLFSNLISNAVRYAKSEVRLICRKEGEEILVSVEDDGAGIAEEDMPHLFERFYKGKDGRHGIGLAIAKAAAETGGGTITCRNQNGAVFEVRFPSGNQSA